VEITLWLAVFGVGFWLSLAAHEAGHVIVGLRHGWEVAGFYFKPAGLGIGVRMGHRSTDPVDWHIGPVAVAGPVASFFVAGVFLEPRATAGRRRRTGGARRDQPGGCGHQPAADTDYRRRAHPPRAVRLDAQVAAHGRRMGNARARRSCVVSAVREQSGLKPSAFWD
jgi:hypothetical protein